MKLYYSPGACSLAPHILLEEVGDKFNIERVDLATKKTETGSDFNTINKKGYVPVLEIAPDFRLTENIAILQYIAENAKRSDLVPKSGTKEYYRTLEMLAFVSTELHKNIGALFAKGVPEEAIAKTKQKIDLRLNYVNDLLGHQDYLLGNSFTAPDAYAFVVIGWCDHLGIDLKKWPNIQKYLERVGKRPAVQAALKAEGLTK